MTTPIDEKGAEPACPFPIMGDKNAAECIANGSQSRSQGRRSLPRW